jgi:hypothetical protein
VRLKQMIRPRVVGPIAATMLVTVGLVGATYVNRTHVAAAAAQTAAGTAASQILFVDQITGQPREATPAELEQLRQLQQQAAVVVAPEPVVSEVGGLEGLRLSDDQMVYSVATKKADGSIAIGDVTGKHGADAAVRRAGLPQVLTVQKEARNDR